MPHISRDPYDRVGNSPARLWPTLRAIVGIQRQVGAILSPTVTLRFIAPSIYAVEATLPVPGAALPLRCAIVQLEGGGVVLHSPVAIDEATAQQIDALGHVRAIIAPSGLHYLFASQAKLRWPEAELWASPAVRKKAPQLGIANELGATRWPYAAELRQFSLDGAPKVQEVVFFHQPSATLLVTDLVFNILEPKGLLAGLIYRLFGTYRHFDSSRLYRHYIADKAAFAESLEPVLAQPFSRIVMSHGDVIESADLPQRLRDVTRRLCS